MSGPDVWGPHGWKFIHYVTLGYPNNPSVENKKNYYSFFETLKNVIPCRICGNHFKEHLKIYPLTDQVLSNKMELIKWGINMHNMVNRTNKKIEYTFEEGYLKILNDNKNENCSANIIENFSNDTNKILIIIFSLIILSGLGYILYKFKYKE